MDAKEIAHRALQIERASADRSYGDVLTLLGDLDKLHVATEQPETTHVVQVLHGLLKSCSDAGVKRAAESLLSKWKRPHGEDAGGVRSTDDGEGAEISGDGAASSQGDAQSASAQPGDSGMERAKCEASLPDGTSASFSSVRSKCVQLLLASLGGETPGDKAAAGLAGDIERHVYERHKSSPVKYKACVRSKVANLRNPKNGHLRRGLSSGSLSAEAFARMSAVEMASAELRRLREEYSSRGVSERQLPRGLEGTETRKVRCERCGGSDCRVTQVSRGALFLPAWVRRSGPDDDTMTFVTCGGCGQQWYHSGWVCL